ncbi:MAG: DPP IV N-terminal domain-containing protein [Proteobacteria bacterium]|nr:DPP IV N-terminal domain-containing protein [Pseudomonadota bacterium]
MTTDENDLVAAYRRAERLLPWNAASLAVNLDLQPVWIPGRDAVFYRRGTEAGWTFEIADLAKGTSAPAFDHTEMATLLGEHLDETLSPQRLPISRYAFEDDNGTISVQVGARTFRCSGDSCREVHTSKGDATSPDGRYAVFSHRFDLHVRNLATGDVRALTTDGDARHAYARPAGHAAPVTRALAKLNLTPIGQFSPDGERFATYRLDEADEPDLTLLQNVPQDGSIRPIPWTYPTALPSDQPPTATLVIFELNSGAQVRTDHSASPLQLFGPVFFEQSVWSPDGAFFYFVDYRDAFREIALYRVDAATGAVTRLIAEHSKTSQFSYLRPRFMVLASGEIVWPSRRSGSERLYLLKADGTLSHALTEEGCLVRDVLHIDEAARVAYFSAAGADPSLDPYLRQLYSVNLDKGPPQRLTQDETDHQAITPIREAFSPPALRSTFSTSGKYFVDCYSRIDLPSITVVRNRSGALAMTLAEGRLMQVAQGIYTVPQTIQGLAADGLTPIWGTIYHPSDFDPHRRYPVIDYMYGGPQTTFVPKRFFDDVAGFYGRYLAELGFVVVNIDGRGTPLRSQAFQDASYGALGNAGHLDDHIALLKSVAEKRPYLDLDKVGAYGFSGGGYAVVHALLDYPDFYRVGVAMSPYDPLLTEWSWGEKFFGPYDRDRYREQASYANAANLRGKLLIAAGDLDDVAHPASLMRIANALIAANKTFDMLVVPNADHNLMITPYALKRTWDYFVQHLLGAQPPAEYLIGQAFGTS